ncbi:hypothetical protein IP88_02250 [alpha proteobacterium AAP81b]|nr:hypothetical protein IP88_02250 [alpha proteobacterium AAP81b]
MASSVRQIDPQPPVRATTADFSSTHLIVTLSDDRRLELPLAWYPRLRDATLAERQNWRLIGTGSGIHWPAIDEDLSVAGMLAGRRAAA